MLVGELWRYPVKSMQGERVDRVIVDADGLAGDRRFAVFDCATGNFLTARRVPELLFASAHYRDDGGVEVTLPDGSTATDDDALSAWLGREVVLRDAAYDDTRTYEVPLDIETEAAESWVAWNGPRGAFHDSTRTRVSLVSYASIGSWEPRRFRANVLLDGADEDALVGKQVRVGSVLLDVTKQIDRCVMVGRPQPDGIDEDRTVLRTIIGERAGNLAIGALVAEPGEIAVGDEISVV